jgi:hypothetical protein
MYIISGELTFEVPVVSDETPDKDVQPEYEANRSRVENSTTHNSRHAGQTRIRKLCEYLLNLVCSA